MSRRTSDADSAAAGQCRSRGGAWLQFNCALFPESPGRPGYMPWADLQSAVDRWRQEGRFQRFFFVRKAPGVRLRFFGHDLDERLMPVLVAWLDHEERLNAIRSYRLARYEPEDARFGGSAGIDIAHDAFDRDSRHTMRYALLPKEAQAELPRRTFSLLVTNDLYGRRIDDTAELWDIWHRLGKVVGDVAITDASTEAEDISLALTVLSHPHAFVTRVSANVAQLLTDAWSDNAETIARLHAAEQTGQLAVGPRAWLASLSVFHWNRLAFAPADLAPMVAAMLQLFRLPEHDA